MGEIPGGLQPPGFARVKPVMRRLWLGCAALGLGACVGAMGCNADVPGTTGFGSGGHASEPTGGPADTSPAGPSSQTDGGETGASSADAAGDGPSTAAGSDSGEDTDGGSQSGGPSTLEGSDDGSDDGSDTGGSEAGTGAGSSGGETDSDTGAAGETDACGFLLDGPWLEIEYWQSGVPATSPSWSYSDTPGWGEDEWAAQNANWPEMWDLYQNINVVDDPIGVVAVVGSSGQLQLMLGFEELIDYDSATLCVEGRSVSAVSSVQFDAYNPLTGWGNSAMMAHNWEVHAVGLELGQPFEIGGGVQAVRLDTTGGSSALGVQRMRLILHGAVY